MNQRPHITITNVTNLKLQISIQIEKKSQISQQLRALEIFMKAKKKFSLTTSFTQKKLSSIISIRTKVTLIRKNVNKKEPNFLIFCNFGSDWDNWAQFFLGERCGQNKLFLSFHKNFYSSQLLRYLAFFLNLNWIWSFRLVILKYWYGVLDPIG